VHAPQGCQGILDIQIVVNKQITIKIKHIPGI
jgi:hypothetical protein